MHEADGDRLDSIAAHRLDERPEARDVELGVDAAVVAVPLHDFVDVVPRDEPGRLPVAEGVQLLAVVPGNRIRVRKLGRHRQEDARPLDLLAAEGAEEIGRDAIHQLEVRGERGHVLLCRVEHFFLVRLGVERGAGVAVDEDGLFGETQ